MKLINKRGGLESKDNPFKSNEIMIEGYLTSSDEIAVLHDDELYLLSSDVWGVEQDVSNGSAKEAEALSDGGTGRKVTIPGITRQIGIHEPVYYEPTPSNFTWAELTKDGTRLPINKAVTYRLVALAKYLDKVRDFLGCPMAVTSGYRPPAINRAVGGASDSRHMYGDAADFRPMGMSVEDAFEMLKDYHTTGGLAVGNGFVHIDMRPGNAVRWHYSNGPKVSLW